MTDIELDVADSFERVFPVPTVVADWDDVLDRAGARSGTPTRPPSRRRWVIVAVAGLVLVGGLLVTPGLGVGSRLLDLIWGGPRCPRWGPGTGRPTGGGSRSSGIPTATPRTPRSTS